MYPYGWMRADRRQFSRSGGPIVADTGLRSAKTRRLSTFRKDLRPGPRVPCAPEANPVAGSSSKSSARVRTALRWARTPHGQLQVRGAGDRPGGAPGHPSEGRPDDMQLDLLVYPGMRAGQLVSRKQVLQDVWQIPTTSRFPDAEGARPPVTSQDRREPGPAPLHPGRAQVGYASNPSSPRPPKRTHPDILRKSYVTLRLGWCVLVRCRGLGCAPNVRIVRCHRGYGSLKTSVTVTPPGRRGRSRGGRNGRAANDRPWPLTRRPLGRLSHRRSMRRRGWRPRSRLP